MQHSDALGGKCSETLRVVVVVEAAFKCPHPRVSLQEKHGPPTQVTVINCGRTKRAITVGEKMHVLKQA